MTPPNGTAIVELAIAAAVVLALAVLTSRLRRGQQAVVAASTELQRSEQRFRRLAESSPLGIFELDGHGRRVYANPRLEEIIGGFDIPAPTDPGPDTSAQSGRWRIRRADGELRWVRFDAVPLAPDRPETGSTGWIGSITDVTDERELAEHNARLSDVIEITPDLVAVIDVRGQLTYLNQAARDVWGLAADTDLTDMSVLLGYATSSRDLVAREALPTALRDGVWTGEVMLRRYDGTELPVSQVVVAHKLADGTVDYLSCISRDISERRDFEAAIVYQGLHDPLTNLANRVLFADRLHQALARAERHHAHDGPNKPTPAVFLLDLDHFKLVNDSYGHDVGDQLLLRAAERISATLRPGDTAARFGGDEFAVLCEEVFGASHADQIAQDIASALAVPFELGDNSEGETASRAFVTASVGIALPSDLTASPESLLRDADAALNRAKDDGRDRHVLFVEDYRQSAVHRLRTANDLHRALEEQEFRVVYQPEVSLADGHVVAVEALVRWQHPERGLVPPAEFIPLAEETGIVVPIGQWVLEQAVQQAGEWMQRQPNNPLIVWVNLSARQLVQRDLLETVAATLKRNGVPAQRLGLEITESALLEDADHAIGMLTALRELGVLLAVDDFGTGYSSLAYLRQLPVDQLKIDRSFIDGLGVDDEAWAIVAAVTGLARALRLTTVAEGVETAEQVKALRGLDCDLAQGYFFTTPQRPANITRLLEGGSRAPLLAPAGHLVATGGPHVAAVDRAAQRAPVTSPEVPVPREAHDH
jgi:diguanylate cyclase (GGDEF)-like protein/PAS domain S-box-containing protein